MFKKDEIFLSTVPEAYNFFLLILYVLPRITYNVFKIQFFFWRYITIDTYQ